MSGQSLLSVAGAWVAWVYALSLSLALVLGPIDNPVSSDPWSDWSREVVFSSPGVTVNESQRDGLADLKAIATKPAPRAGTIRVSVEEKTAKLGADFEVAHRGAEFFFEKGATEGTLRFLEGWGPDVRIVASPEHREPRSFRLHLRSGPDAVSAGDLAMCTVTIDDGKAVLPAGLTPVRFASDTKGVPLVEKRVPFGRLTTTAVEVKADAAVAEPVPISFELFRGEQSLGTFERELATGDRDTTFRLADVFEPEQLEKMGLVDDGRAGPDEAYEVRMMASSPLFPDQPRICRLVAENTNEPPRTRLVYFDRNKREIDWLDPEGYVTAEYVGGTLRDRSTQVIEIDGKPLPEEVVIDPRAGRGSLVSLAGQGLGGKQGTRVGAGSSPGKGCCKGQGGCSGKALCGEPVPGDYMLIVVNNERLHEQGDGIVDQVRKALADESAKPYGNGAIIVNPTDEDSMTPEGGGPDPQKMFRPFEEQGHDVASQLARVEEVVARKREAAQKPDLRAVVVWPERDLAARQGVRPVAGEGLQPISVMLPDADASYARDIHRGLVPRDVAPGAVTVRAPKEAELRAHLTNVMSEGVAVTPEGSGSKAESAAPGS